MNLLVEITQIVRLHGLYPTPGPRMKNLAPDLEIGHLHWQYLPLHQSPTLCELVSFNTRTQKNPIFFYTLILTFLYHVEMPNLQVRCQILHLRARCWIQAMQSYNLREFYKQIHISDFLHERLLPILTLKLFQCDIRLNTSRHINHNSPYLCC